jgi:hypothetical protein
VRELSTDLCSNSKKKTQPLRRGNWSASSLKRKCSPPLPCVSLGIFVYNILDCWLKSCVCGVIGSSRPHCQIGSRIRLFFAYELTDRGLCILVSSMLPALWDAWPKGCNNAPVCSVRDHSLVKSAFQFAERACLYPS